jgi:hypothetical protein
VRFIEQVGGISGQPGTEQAFVYWQSPPALDSSAQSVTVAPEPPTALLLLCGLLFAKSRYWFLSPSTKAVLGSW